MTATLLWQYHIMTANGSSPCYSVGMGSAQLLNDNMVVMIMNVPTDEPTVSNDLGDSNESAYPL
jgi:hypothetical protein